MEFELGGVKGRVWEKAGRRRIYLYGIAEYGKDAYIEDGRLVGRSADFGLRKRGITVEEIVSYVEGLGSPALVSGEDRKKEIFEALQAEFNAWGKEQKRLEAAGLLTAEQGKQMWAGLLRARKALMKKPADWFTSGWRASASALDFLFWADGRTEDWIQHLPEAQ